MKIQEIKEIAQMMSSHDLTEFVVECDEMKLQIKRGAEVNVVSAAPQVVQQAPAAPPAAPAEEKTEEAPLETTIDSPIVGTFYAAPSPDADLFVKIGDQVTEDTVVCIVEAMKVMNEIKAEKTGVVKRILAENGSPVEYGQPLFEIAE